MTRQPKRHRALKLSNSEISHVHNYRQLRDCRHQCQRHLVHRLRYRIDAQADRDRLARVRSPNQDPPTPRPAMTGRPSDSSAVCDRRCGDDQCARGRCGRKGAGYSVC